MASPLSKLDFGNAQSFSHQVLFQGQIVGTGYPASTPPSRPTHSVKLIDHFQNKEQKTEQSDEFVVAYVDTLLNLELPEENRKLNAGEIVTLCRSREIKMMSFGAGRRMCPAYAVAMLHLEYFVANLVWQFQWDSVEGDDGELSEKVEFTSVMKNPLRARIFPRVNSV
uniref:Cytochrome P450 n=1 Tax=Solanum tuberosum TaxID=4113 RepID=M0ZU47_SOLTU